MTGCKTCFDSICINMFKFYYQKLIQLRITQFVVLQSDCKKKGGGGHAPPAPPPS